MNGASFVFTSKFILIGRNGSGVDFVDLAREGIRAQALPFVLFSPGASSIAVPCRSVVYPLASYTGDTSGSPADARARTQIIGPVCGATHRRLCCVHGHDLCVRVNVCVALT